MEPAHTRPFDCCAYIGRDKPRLSKEKSGRSQVVDMYVCGETMVRCWGEGLFAEAFVPTIDDKPEEERETWRWMAAHRPVAA
jgi:hypothetical protein